MIPDPTAHLFKKSSASTALKIQGPATPKPIKIVEAVANVTKAAQPKKTARDAINNLTNKAILEDGNEMRSFLKKANTPPPVWHVPTVKWAKFNSLGPENAPAEGAPSYDEQVASKVNAMSAQNAKYTSDAEREQDVIEALIDKEDETSVDAQNAQTLKEDEREFHRQLNASNKALRDRMRVNIKTQNDLLGRRAMAAHRKMQNAYDSPDFASDDAGTRVEAAKAFQAANVASNVQDKQYREGFSHAQYVRAAHARYAMLAAARPEIEAAHAAAARAAAADAAAAARKDAAARAAGAQIVTRAAAAAAANKAAAAAAASAFFSASGPSGRAGGAAGGGAGGAGSAGGAGPSGAAGASQISPQAAAAALAAADTAAAAAAAAAAGLDMPDAAVLAAWGAKFPNSFPEDWVRAMAAGYSLGQNRQLYKRGTSGGAPPPAYLNATPSAHAIAHPGGRRRERGDTPAEQIVAPNGNNPPPLPRDAH